MVTLFQQYSMQLSTHARTGTLLKELYSFFHARINCKDCSDHLHVPIKPFFTKHGNSEGFVDIKDALVHICEVLTDDLKALQMEWATVLATKLRQMFEVNA